MKGSVMSITCIHGLEASACSRCRPARPMPKPKPKPVRKPKPKSDPIEDQHRLELAIQAARQAAHAGTLLSKQLGKKPRQLAAIRLADHG
nr:MAG TPA: hypothetical protein [Caudoviricetes sp.]DAN79716.1 MAG TPA: hypothetical protein [Caudoviricetes sp.]